MAVSILSWGLVFGLIVRLGTAAVVTELGAEVDVDFGGAAVGNRLATGITVRLAGWLSPAMAGQQEGPLDFECVGLEVRGVRCRLAEFRV